MKTIHLYGHLATSFGDKVELDVATAGEAIRALCSTRPDFEDTLKEGSFTLIRYRRSRSARLTGEAFREAMENDGLHLDETTLEMGLGKADLHIVPVVGGAGGKGLGKVLLGVAIIAGAWFAAPTIFGAGMAATVPGIAGGLGLTYGNIAMFGAMMALGGISQMLTKPPSAPEAKGSEETNFIFGGAVNISGQGNPVALIYGGPILVGSLVVSSAVVTESRRSAGGLTVEEKAQQSGGGFYGVVGAAFMDRDKDGFIDGTEYRDTTNIF